MQQDYLIRMIQNIIKALARSLGLIDQEKFSEAHQIIDREFEKLTGLSIDSATAMSPLALSYILKINKDKYHLLAIADALYHKGLAMKRQELLDQGNLFSSRARLILDSIEDKFEEQEYIARLGFLDSQLPKASSAG